MIVREAMTPNPITVDANASVLDVAQLMSEKGIGSIIIIDGETVSGIVTERDLVRRVLALNRDPQVANITEIMSSPVVTISPREDVTSAAKLMKAKRIRRLAVMENERLVGIITTDDLTRNMMRIVEEFATTLFIMERRTQFDRDLIRSATRE